MLILDLEWVWVWELGVLVLGWEWELGGWESGWLGLGLLIIITNSNNSR